MKRFLIDMAIIGICIIGGVIHGHSAADLIKITLLSLIFTEMRMGKYFK